MLTLANTYDMNGHFFRTLVGEVYVNYRVIGTALGLPRTGSQFSAVRTEHVEVIAPYKRRSLLQLHSMVQENPGGPTFRRTFLMAALKCCICPNTFSVSSLAYLAAIVDVDNPQQYNWCRYIHEYLVDGIQQYREKNLKTINGFLYVLKVMYFHMGWFGDFDLLRDPLPPWVRYWTHDEIKKQIKEERLSSTMSTFISAFVVFLCQHYFQFK